MIVKANIKKLKREYGRLGTVYRLVSTTTDLTYGTKRQVFQYRVIRKIIFMPNRETRAGGYDPGLRKALVDRDDTFELKVGDYVIIDNKTYSMKEVDDYAGEAYKLILKTSDTEVIDFGEVSETITLTDEVSYVKL